MTINLTIVDDVASRPDPLRPDPRLIAAEAVATCALQLVATWWAWESLNRSALAAIGTKHERDTHLALQAYELLDQAVQVWTPHAHPAITAAAAHASRP